MDEMTARRICRCAVEIAENLRASIVLDGTDKNPAEYRRLSRAVTHITRELYAELVAPVLAKHPNALPPNTTSLVDPLVVASGIRSSSADRRFVPLDKSDTETADMLAKLDPNVLERIAPYLMIWIQDMNWPVAGRVSGALVRLGAPTIPLIQTVLLGDDDIWKHNCIRHVAARFTRELAQQLKPELLRIVERPSRGEQEEDVVEAASEVLQELFGQETR